jgi:hypothetical protein
LVDAFPVTIDFGSLDYGSDDFVTITITWEYRSFDVYMGTPGDTPGASLPSVITSDTDTSTTTSQAEAIKLDGSFT